MANWYASSSEHGYSTHLSWIDLYQIFDIHQPDLVWECAQYTRLCRGTTPAGLVAASFRGLCRKNGEGFDEAHYVVVFFHGEGDGNVHLSLIANYAGEGASAGGNGAGAEIVFTPGVSIH